MQTLNPWDIPDLPELPKREVPKRKLNQIELLVEAIDCLKSEISDLNYEVQRLRGELESRNH